MSEGFGLMLIGMSVVFSFLGILVMIMNLMTLFFKKYAKYFPEEIKEKKQDQVLIANTDIAVVIAAVKSYLKN